MINRKQLVAGGLAVISYFAISAPAVADVSDLAPEHDVNLCVAEVQDNADYSDAVYVRHDIESTKRRRAVYALAIETSVYADADASGAPMREYKAICVVRGGEKPIVFRIKQKGDAA